MLPFFEIWREHRDWTPYYYEESEDNPEDPPTEQFLDSYHGYRFFYLHTEKQERGYEDEDEYE